MAKYDKLRSLLDKEPFPQSYPIKFIGKNSPDFEKGVLAFEARHPELVFQSRNYSQNRRHVSMTYVLRAEGPDPIITTLMSVDLIPDLLFVC